MPTLSPESFSSGTFTVYEPGAMSSPSVES
jgi:hypothetical protein